MGNSCTNVSLMHGNSKNEMRETDREGKKRGMSMLKTKAGMKKKIPEGLSLPNKNTINIIW